MSNAARKARKRSGEPFVREPKVGTPLMQRMIPIVNKVERGVPTRGPSHRFARKMNDRFVLLESFKPKPEDKPTRKRAPRKTAAQKKAEAGE